MARKKSSLKEITSGIIPGLVVDGNAGIYETRRAMLKAILELAVAIRSVRQAAANFKQDKRTSGAVWALLDLQRESMIKLKKLDQLEIESITQ